MNNFKRVLLEEWKYISLLIVAVISLFFVIYGYHSALNTLICVISFAVIFLNNTKNIKKWSRIFMFVLIVLCGTMIVSTFEANLDKIFYYSRYKEIEKKYQKLLDEKAGKILVKFPVKKKDTLKNKVP